MSNFLCQADEYNGRMWCGRCDQSWSKAEEEKVSCKPKASPPIGLAEMEQVARSAARKIIDSQHAAIRAEFRTEPYVPALREAAVLVAAASVLEKVRGDARIMELLKGGK